MVETAKVRDESAELSRVDIVISVGIGPNIAGAREARSAGGIIPGDDAAAKLIRVARVRRANERLAVRAQRIVGAHTRLEGLPLELDRSSVESQAGHEIREERIGRNSRGRVLSVLIVIPNPDVDGQVARGDRVPDESVVVGVFQGRQTRPEDVGGRAAVGADGSALDELLPSEDAVAGIEDGAG